MSYPSREQLGEQSQELWDQGGAVGALVNLAQTIRNAADSVAGAVEGVACELDRERRGDLSVMQRGDFKVVLDTITGLLNEPMLADDQRGWLRDKVLAALHPECMGASQ